MTTPAPPTHPPTFGLSSIPPWVTLTIMLASAIGGAGTAWGILATKVERLTTQMTRLENDRDMLIEVRAELRVVRTLLERPARAAVDPLR